MYWYMLENIRQTDGLTDKQTGEWTDEQTNHLKEGWTDRQIGRQQIY